MTYKKDRAMILVSEQLIKKIISAAIIFLYSTIACSQTVVTEQCSTLNLKATTETNKTFIHQLVSNNNSLINAKVYDDEQHALLLPGKHSLQLRTWLAGDYQHYKSGVDSATGQALLKKANHHTLLITAEANYQYQLIPSADNSNGLTLSKTKQPCILNGRQGMLAKFEPLSSKLVSSLKLSDELESRLYHVMDKILYQQTLSIAEDVTTRGKPSKADSSDLNIHSDAITSFAASNTFKPMATHNVVTNIVPLKLMGSFGVTFDNGSDPVNKQLRVLSIFPFSVASQLKLISGDVVLKLNNQDMTGQGSANEKFQMFINQLTIGGEIKMLVMRDNKKHILRGTYMPIIVPESHYQIMPSHAMKANLDEGCASIKTDITGLGRYRIIEHNGNTLSANNEREGLTLLPGVHRFKAKFIRWNNPYPSQDSINTDIAPRVRGGSRFGNAGVKALTQKRTGSIKGWFNDTSSRVGNAFNIESLQTTPNRLNTSFVNIVDTINISTYKKRKHLLSFTLTVERDQKYKLNIARANNNSTADSGLILKPFVENDKIACNISSGKISSDSKILTPLVKKVDLVNASLLAENVRFEFEQLLVEIKNYYHQHGLTQGVVDLYRAKQLTYNFGVNGEIVKNGQGYGLFIREVNVNSLASAARIKAGDTIVALNGASFSKPSGDEFLEGLRALTHGQELLLLVQRDNKEITLSAKYTSRFLPAFYLSVDLNSINKAQRALQRNII
jgi:C-terminal processing protease CtpA/Prc